MSPASCLCPLGYCLCPLSVCFTYLSDADLLVEQEALGEEGVLEGAARLLDDLDVLQVRRALEAQHRVHRQLGYQADREKQVVRLEPLDEIGERTTSFCWPIGPQRTRWSKAM